MNRVVDGQKLLLILLGDNGIMVMYENGQIFTGACLSLR